MKIDDTEEADSLTWQLVMWVGVENRNSDVH